MDLSGLGEASSFLASLSKRKTLATGPFGQKRVTIHRQKSWAGTLQRGRKPGPGERRKALDEGERQ